MRARKLLIATLGVASALVLCEATLQVVSWVVWSRSARAPAALEPGGGRVILCVGDSFTYGFGSAPANSYPRRTEARLREGGGDWRVVNAGWPGNHSANVLHDVERTCTAYRPDLAYVLIGCNDVWREGADPDVGFRVELRTLKLARLVWHRLASGAGPAGGDAPPAEASPPFVGEWHAGPMHVRLLADGRVELPHAELQWAMDGRELVLRAPTSDPILVAWQLDGNTLVLTGGPWPNGVRLSPGPPSSSTVDLGFAALRQGERGDAERRFEQALQQDPVDPEAWRGLCEVLVATGRGELAIERLGALRAEFERAPAERAGDALVAGYRVAHAIDAAVAVAARMLTVLPPRERLLGFVNVHGGRADDPETLVAALERALARSTQPAFRARLLAVKANLVRERDPVAALETLVAAWREHGHDDVLEYELRNRPETFTPAVVSRAVARLRTADAARLEALHAKVASEEPHLALGLGARLVEIVRRYRQNGVEPVLLVYPRPFARVDQAVRHAVRATDAGFLDVTARFRELLETVPASELFILDGHCTDRGYDEIAKLVAADVRRRIE
jgi:hypothetical protein